MSLKKKKKIEQIFFHNLKIKKKSHVFRFNYNTWSYLLIHKKQKGNLILNANLFIAIKQHCYDNIRSEVEEWSEVIYYKQHLLV